jgi:hypothetical protein
MFCYHAECQCAECHYAECRYAECRYAGCRSAGLSDQKDLLAAKTRTLNCIKLTMTQQAF